MKIEELMARDWVHNDLGETQQVVELREDGAMLYYNDIYPYDDIQPIPLTPEILEENGFVKSERFEVWKIISDEYELRITPWRFAVIFLDEDGSDKEEFSAPRPKYVHELQHVLRLYGVEKDIIIKSTTHE